MRGGEETPVARGPSVVEQCARAVRFLLAWGTPVAIGLLLAHSSCSPSSPDVEGLIAPPSVSVVTLNPAASGAHVRALAPAGFPPGADYFVDPLRETVHDGSLGVIVLVNEVLCRVHQSRYGALRNRGPYRALIDEARCGPESGRVNEPGRGAALRDWTVRSTRRSAREPQRVAFWVPGMDGAAGASAPKVTLFAALDVFAPPTAANPWGVFRMDFAAVSTARTLSNPDFCGLIAAKVPASGRIGFRLFLLVGEPNQLPPPGEEHERTQADVDLSADQQSGVAHVVRTWRRNDPQLGDSGIQVEDHRVAFDATTLVRSRDGGNPLAFDRAAFRASILRYNLYEDGATQSGRRVKLDSGTPILLPDGSHGLAGYDGLHLPAGSSARDGDVVFRVKGGAVDPAPLTLRTAPGRLIENRRNATPLPQVLNETFEWDRPFDPQNPGPFRFRLVYDGVGFLAVEQFDFALGVWFPISPAYVNVANFGVLRLRSARYGGNASYTDGASEIAWYAERVVNGDPALFGGSGGPLPLFGFQACLRPGLTAIEAEAGDVHFPDEVDPAAPYVYSFQPADLTLYHDDLQGNLAPAGLAPGEAPASGPYVAGMRSGPLVPDVSNLASVNDLWAAPLFYTWESGANPWNGWAGLEDPASGALLPFDPPLQFLYVHSAANDANGDPSQDGKEFLLEYRGDGRLRGIPTVAIDTDGDGLPDHDVPILNLADGVAVGPTGVEFVVRAVERELLLLPAGGAPPGLDPSLADSLALLDGSSYVTPAIGPLPAVAAPPAVVGGEIQRARGR